MKQLFFIPCLFLIAFTTSAQSLFTKLASGQTGVNFVNKLPETPELNIITYEYFYNGGGVAVADFNNDGLSDLYLTSNLQPNRLYINQGNWQFKDVTRAANVGGRRGWKTGVSVADVNADGWVDIYVCYSGDVDAQYRKNQLLINNGDMTFSDKAAEMGVADAGYSTQAVFFDHDRDSDLDLFVLNHNIKNLRNFDAEFVKKMVDPDAGDRLYRNDNNVFTDITAQAGIISNPLGYGLGIAVSDLNNDGWPDLYVANDYVEEDYLYINKQDGTYQEKLKTSFGHLSNFSMGVDVADINNDGWTDIYSLDMLPEDNKRQKLIYAPDNYEVYLNTLKNGFYHQLMRNMLQLNNQDGTFSEVGQVAGISNTDWSWSALFADFDNDGLKDLFVSNGYGRDMINRDFMKFYASERLKHLQGKTDDKMFQMLQSIKSTPLHNYIFRNEGQLQFSDKSAEWGFTEEDFSHGAAYADFDNDGDLDLIVNRMNSVAALYRNNAVENAMPGNWINVQLQMPGKNLFGIGAKISVHTAKGTITQENFPVRGFQSAMHIPMHIGLPSSQIDSLVIRWPDGVRQTITAAFTNHSTVKIEYAQSAQKNSEATPKQKIFTRPSQLFPFTHLEDVTNDFKQQPLMPNMFSYAGPHLIKGDVDKDGFDDVFVTGAKARASQVLVQISDGSFVARQQLDLNKDARFEDTDAAFFDADQDGDLDLYVVSGGFISDSTFNHFQDRLYLNVNGAFKASPGALPVIRVSGACVRPFDIDGDGDIDLFRGSRVQAGRYPEAPASFVLINDGKGNFTDETSRIAPLFQNLGMITDAIWIDINNDKKTELLVCGEWMALKCFGIENGKLTDKTEEYFSQQYTGWWNRLAASDLDKDGDLDLVAANWGLNSQMKASEKTPVTMTFADFDNNGSVDPILCYYIQGKSYPMASRDELTDQVISLRRKFPTYDIYSTASMNEILTKEQQQAARTLKAEIFETVYFENTNGKLVLKRLPVQANFAPVYAIAIDDFNKDGNSDILLGGNIEHTRLKIGKIDANYGVLLTGDGRGNFEYAIQPETGLSVWGCVRDIIKIKIKNQEHLLFGINNQKIELYKY